MFIIYTQALSAPNTTFTDLLYQHPAQDNLLNIFFSPSSEMLLRSLGVASLKAVSNKLTFALSMDCFDGLSKESAVDTTKDQAFVSAFLSWILS